MIENLKRLTGTGVLLLAAMGWTLAQEQGSQPAEGQKPPADEKPGASVGAEIGEDGGGRIVVEARGMRPKVPVFFNASTSAKVTAGTERITQEVRLTLKVVQGEAETLTLGLIGNGEVYAVEGDLLRSWSVRREGNQRFLDLRVKKGVKEVSPLVKIRSAEFELPFEGDITHFAPGKAVGFNSVIHLAYASAVEGRVVAADGFLPIGEKGKENTFQSATGGRLRARLMRLGALPEAVELVNAALQGTVGENGKSITFRLTATARVTEADASVDFLRGTVGVARVAGDTPYRLRLVQEGSALLYRLEFDEPGEYPINLEFSSAVQAVNGWKSVDFSLVAGAIVPLTLTGIEKESEFSREGGVAMLADKVGDAWQGFLPANGKARFSWKPSRKTGEGKLFFTSTGRIETMVGAGLLRQSHSLSLRVLQGELRALQFDITGSGEVLDVSGNNVLAWAVKEEGGASFLDITLSQPVKKSADFLVRTQSALGAFPTTVKAMRLSPRGVVRHSGHLRLMNEGSVRLAPSALSGLTQLSPDQFPGEAVNARQVFVYRFPAADYDFEVTAERIQPEVNVSQVLVYQLGETDRVITASIEFDIREAPIREWDLGIPADYSVVSVSGANVADYVVGTAPEAGVRSLKVLFGQDVSGRQLVSLHLEKNEAAAAGDWVLPRLSYEDAKSVRGDIGVVGAAGFRIGVGATDLLTEKPLSYFPNPVANLQQAFRIREREWSASVTIEALEKSVQADVFHLYSLSDGTAYASIVINYFVTGAPVSELEVKVPAGVGNVGVDGLDVRTWRQENESLFVTLHQPVMGSYTLLLTFEEKVGSEGGSLSAGRVEPVGVQGERGYVHVVSPVLVKSEVTSASEGLLKLDPLELPAEFRLLTSFPSLGVYQYTERPFNLAFNIAWFDPGSTTAQVVEFCDVKSRVSADGQVVTEVTYDVKSRGRQPLRLQLPDGVQLWAVRVAGRSVTARQDGPFHLIPLPGTTDPNVPVEVVVNLAKPGNDGSETSIELPKVSSLVLKTEWEITGEEEQVLLPTGGSVAPAKPVEQPTGFNWLATSRQGLGYAAAAVLTALLGGILARNLSKAAGVVFLVGAICLAVAGAVYAMHHPASVAATLRMSLSVVTPGEDVQVAVKSVSGAISYVSTPGIIALAGGALFLIWSFFPNAANRRILRGAGILLVSIGVLFQHYGAPYFFALIAAAIGLFLVIPILGEIARAVATRQKSPPDDEPDDEPEDDDDGPAPTPEGTGAGAAATIILLGALLMAPMDSEAKSAPAPPLIPDGYIAADSIRQTWEISEKRLEAKGKLVLSGRKGDRIVFLREPSVLKSFEGEGLRVTRGNIPGRGLCYIVHISGDAAETTKFEADFAYILDVEIMANWFYVPTGPAAVQEINAAFEKPGWEFQSLAAMKLEHGKNANNTSARLLLAPMQEAAIGLKPRSRDVSAEETLFYVEGSNLFTPGPGVVDGRHRIRVRPAQGEVRELSISVPEGLTVSEVGGPVSSWQFDADARVLKAVIEPAQSTVFDLLVETQRALGELPAEVAVSPLKVAEAKGEVGLIALAFGAEAQPEKVESDTLSPVNAGDFDAGLLQGINATLHQVFRYGADGGAVSLRVAPVAPEIRVQSSQKISFGDERIVLAINFAADITRAGIFSLSMPLPEGLEVESLTGGALHHWSEVTEGNERIVVLRLNGKTLGQQSFSLVLTGTTPDEVADWTVPRFEIREASRQEGSLVVVPTTGIRLRTLDRRNVSETDPRKAGGTTQGSLAYRLLQRDWSLQLGIEKLDPWVTAAVLHDVTLREGQTRTTIIARINVQNASIRTMRVELPVSSEDEIKTVRASGAQVSDLVRIEGEENLWEIQFKRRIVEDVEVQIDYERRGDREGLISEVGMTRQEFENVTAVKFPDVRQLTYHLAVRAGGRLELVTGELPQGWQHAEWTAVSPKLREAGNRSAPVMTMRAVTPANPLRVEIRRHSLAESLKLRVSGGTLTTVLSPLGDQMTEVDLIIDVIERSSLKVGLPAGGELFSIFVNDESVNAVREGDAFQFHILPGADDRTAAVRFVYSVPGDQLRKLDLASPVLNVPLENIEWRLHVPNGFELVSGEGDLELRTSDQRGVFSREAYLQTEAQKRQAGKNEARELLDQAARYALQGQQEKANWAFNNVANRSGLDAASNEDARVQLENLQTQQAVVGLNTRRQRLYLDNAGEGDFFAANDQLEEGATKNPILNQNQVNFRPQDIGQLLLGNTTEENAVLHRIAGRLVKHQQSAEPAAQAITLTLPEEGKVYTFTRTVQVKENAPLELDIVIKSLHRGTNSRHLIVAILLVAFGLAFMLSTRKKAEAA